MVDITTISAVVAAVSVVVGVAVALFEIRHMAKTRATDVIMRLYEKFSSKEWYENVTKVASAEFKDFTDYRERYGLADIIEVALLFDEVGVLLEQNLIDARLADMLFGDSAKLMWEKTRPVLLEIRKFGGQPRMFSHFEHLYSRLCGLSKVETMRQNA